MLQDRFLRGGLPAHHHGTPGVELAVISLAILFVLVSYNYKNYHKLIFLLRV